MAARFSEICLYMECRSDSSGALKTVLVYTKSTDIEEVVSQFKAAILHQLQQICQTITKAEVWWEYGVCIMPRTVDGECMTIRKALRQLLTSKPRYPGGAVAAQQHLRHKAASELKERHTPFRMPPPALHHTGAGA